MTSSAESKSFSQGSGPPNLQKQASSMVSQEANKATSSAEREACSVDAGHPKIQKQGVYQEAKKSTSSAERKSCSPGTGHPKIQKQATSMVSEEAKKSTSCSLGTEHPNIQKQAPSMVSIEAKKSNASTESDSCRSGTGHPKIQKQASLMVSEEANVQCAAEREGGQLAIKKEDTTSGSIEQIARKSSRKRKRATYFQPLPFPYHIDDEVQVKECTSMCVKDEKHRCTGESLLAPHGHSVELEESDMTTREESVMRRKATVLFKEEEVGS